MFRYGFLFIFILLAACQAPDGWQLKLAHSAEGEVVDGSREQLINSIRNGCSIRIAWGARRRADANQTIEHLAEPDWIAVRNSDSVEAQIGNFLINHRVFGEPDEAHPNRERFGGTEKAVFWKANLKTDGSFDAVWYYPHNGEFIERVPQNHPMRWYADCAYSPVEPLFPQNDQAQN